MENGQAPKKNHKKVIIICVCAVAIIAAVVAAIVIILNNRVDDTVNDAYFVTSNRRIVDKTSASETLSLSYGAVATYHVYTVENNEIIKHELFYEFKDDYVAGKNLASIQESASYNHDIKEVKQYGKYVALEYFDDEFYGLTPAEVKEEIELKKQYEEDKKKGVFIEYEEEPMEEEE